jgi:DNA-binding MarR family transcriptional regulator
LLEEFRKINPEMPIQVAATFLVIAETPRIPFREIGLRTGQSSSATNRNVALLAGKYGTPLVAYGRDPNDARNNIAWLTPLGERLAASIAHYMEK